MISIDRYATSPADVCERISKICETSPQRTAVIDGSSTMSYEELNRRSDHFAQYLFNNKVRSGSTVAICMDRSFEWIVAALGILKAGAAYVPLDPSWPEARLLYAVNDSDAVAVIAPDALLARLQLRVPGIDPVRDAVEIGTAPLVERHSIESGNLAYIIYTSGSTGTPKGVEITHANLCHLIEWHIKAFQLTASDRASHLAGLGFDAAVWEIWSTLAAGATLCIPDGTVRLSPDLIQEWLVQSQVTISFVPTVHAARLIKMNWPANTALRFLLTGGDVLHHFPAPDLPFTLVNNYGPTECTVVATSGLVNPQGAGMPSIGKPIHDTFVYLLDEQGQPVQEGQIGEIYIGGGGVGRGYRNLPDATRKSFLPDPFSQAPSTYMYRTGDRGLRRADGQLEFHGRADRQVKIRGQRIELDEISNLLSQYPGVQFGIVTANNSDKGQAELTGHVLFTLEAQAPRAAELQEYLVKHLPSYMVPSKFFRLRELPVSANGKIDLAILSRAVSEPLQSAKHLATPKNDIQAQLLTAVRELLKNPTLGPRDNFFLAGGHSLLGMQLIMRLRETYRVDMTVRELFDVPTVEHLSLMIQRKRAQVRLTSIWEELLRTEQCGPDDTFMSLGGNDHLLDELQLRIAGEFGRYLTRTQLVENPTITTQTALVAAALGDTLLPPGAFMVHSERKRDNIFWLHYPNPKLAEALGPERPLLCLTLTEQDFDTLGEAPTLQEIARRFVPKLLASQSHGPYIVGGFCLGGILSYEVACQLQAAGYEVSLVILLDVPSPDYYRPAELSKLIRRPVYVTKRLKQLGLRKTLVRLLERASQKIQVKAERALVPEHSIRTQEIMETAAYRYTPKRYEGDVALIMASELTPDSPPHEHFLPWWRGIISKTLHEHEIDAIHLDLVEGAAVIQVAEAISSHINQTTKGSLLSNGEIVGAADNAPQLSYGLSGNKARETFSKAAATISTPVTSSAKLTKTPASQLQ